MILGPPVPFSSLPRVFSICCRVSKSAMGDRVVWIWTTALMNQGWGMPKGSVRNQGDRVFRVVPFLERSLIAEQQLWILDPKFEPSDKKDCAIF